MTRTISLKSIQFPYYIIVKYRENVDFLRNYLDTGYSSMICRYGSYGALFPLKVSKEIKIIEGIIAGITHIAHMPRIQYPQIQAESLFAE